MAGIDELNAENPMARLMPIAGNNGYINNTPAANFGIDYGSTPIQDNSLGMNMQPDYSPESLFGNGNFFGANTGIGLGSSEGNSGIIADILGGKFGSMQGWGAGMKGVGSLVSAYNGYQANKQAKEQFKTQKDFANRNMANQAAITNQNLRDRRSGRRSVFGGNAGTGAQVNGAAI